MAKSVTTIDPVLLRALGFKRYYRGKNPICWMHWDYNMFYNPTRMNRAQFARLLRKAIASHAFRLASEHTAKIITD